jgi:hypothetical protein
VRWATGKSHGKLSPLNALYFSDSAPIPPRSIPRTSSTPCSAASRADGGRRTDPNALAAMRKKSILDFVDKKYDALKTKLGTDDRGASTST